MPTTKQLTAATIKHEIKVEEDSEDSLQGAIDGASEHAESATLSSPNSSATSVSAAAAAAAECERSKMKELTQQALEKIKLFEQRSQELERIRSMEQLQRKEVRDQIERSFQMIERFLGTRKSKLNEMLDEVMQHRMEAVTKETAQITAQVSELREAADHWNSMINDEADDVEPRMQAAAAASKKLLKAKPKTHPSEEDNVSFYPAELDQVFSHIHRAGLVVVGSVQAHNSSLENESEVRVAHLHEERQAIVVPRDGQNRKVDASILGSINCIASITSPYEKAYFVSVMQDDDQVKVKFQLDEEGTYDLNIKMFGEHIKGSPFTVRAVAAQENGDGRTRETRRRSSIRPSSSSRLPTLTKQRQQLGSQGTVGSLGAGIGGSAALQRRSGSRASRQSLQIEDDLIFKVGSRGRGHSEFSNPQGVCVSRDGRIIVADANNANLQVFGVGGEFLNRFGIRGRDPGQLQRPIDVAESINGNFLVSDYENRCIHVFSSDGKYLSKFGGNRLLGPKGISVLSDGQIVVVDNKGCCVLLFRSTGKFVQKFGSRGTADHQFAGPHYVAVNSRDEIVISDFHNHCLKVFDTDGTFLHVIGCTGKEAARINAPTGVAVDISDNILVADWGSSSLQIFNGSGTFIQTVNTAGDQLYGPQGVSYSVKQNQLVVIDTGNHCFKSYKMHSL